MKKVWIFFPEMTLAQFPKSDFFIFRWIFFPKMTLAQFPIFGFFIQDSRIAVNSLYFLSPFTVKNAQAILCIKTGLDVIFICARIFVIRTV